MTACGRFRVRRWAVLIGREWALSCPPVGSFSCPPTTTKGVRLHDLRHTTVVWLTAGVHFIQVAKWLGHSSYVLTLTTYADYIPEQEAENPFPEPVAAVPDRNGVKLFG
jgi:integrase